VHVTHLYTGDDDRSHFADLSLGLTTGRGGALFELLAGLEGFAVRDLPPGWSRDFHNAPRRQLVIQLAGTGEIVCGDGTSRAFGPGDLLLADDVTGEGHVSREICGPRRQAYVYLDPELDLAALRAR